MAGLIMMLVAWALGQTLLNVSEDPVVDIVASITIGIAVTWLFLSAWSNEKKIAKLEAEIKKLKRRNG